MDIHKILKEHWGYNSFRPLQEDIITSVLSGHDTLALLPTGGGKSICFQVPALAKEGLCLVISPLIALMKDQVGNLKKRNIKAAAIFSGMTKREIDHTLDNCAYGNYKFLYLSPERLKTKLFQERLKKMSVNLIAIDEAHCISQWGYDFRPAYLDIADLRTLLPNIPFLALTASATNRVQQDIREKLTFGIEQNSFQKSFARSNLSYSVFFEENKTKKLLHILQRVKGTGIVYVRSRKKTKTIADFLNKNRINADFYHGGLDGKMRSRKQDRWLDNKTQVMVCTNAFGMGIDKPDVRVVVHIDLPESMEAYYQEAGRAGRDEKKAYAVLLYNEADVRDLRQNITNKYPSIAVVKQTYQALANYFQIAAGAGEGQSFPFDLMGLCKTYGLSARNVFNAIKVLEENGYITTNDALFQPSRIRFSVNREEVYKVEVANRRIAPYIKGLVRTYGGIFDDYVAVDEKQLARNLRTSEIYVKNALVYMHKNKLIDYNAQKDGPQLCFTKPRANADNLLINKQLLNFRQEVSRDNIEGMITYATNLYNCRSQQLVSYFGEFDSKRCKVCDICLKRNKLTVNDEQFDQISRLVRQKLTEQSMALDELVKVLEDKHIPTVIIQVVRWMSDNQMIVLDEERMVRIV